MESQQTTISRPVILQGQPMQSLLTEVAVLKPLPEDSHYKWIKDLSQMQEVLFNFQAPVQHTQAPALSVGRWIGLHLLQVAVLWMWL